MTGDRNVLRRARGGLMSLAVACACGLLLLPSVLAVSKWLRSDWHALALAEVFWIGWLPVALYIAVRMIVKRRHGECAIPVAAETEGPKP